jgi:arsenate reductase (glutaredoxin)
MKTIVYGISNCDTVKKARAWLAAHGVEHDFHDFRKQGVPVAELDRWLGQFGWEKVLNRQGTTWRKLDAPTQARVQDNASARALLLDQPSAIKRPLVAWSNGERTIGFDPGAWALLARQ